MTELSATRTLLVQSLPVVSSHQAGLLVRAHSESDLFPNSWDRTLVAKLSSEPLPLQLEKSLLDALLLSWRHVSTCSEPDDLLSASLPVLTNFALASGAGQTSV
jgi:hypothetical protein